METLLVAALAVIGSVMGSSGYWNYKERKGNVKDASTQLLLGLAHDRIIFLGMSYVERGWITKDEYEDFIKYLYGPYETFGGNGLAEKVMQEVKKLPMRGVHAPVVQIIKEKHGTDPTSPGF